ncbi:MAG: efflux RND transporter periplasmic adaptor subunit [Bryobacteraceae bacterium]|jgi:multidrug efflux pump subunit AcrA (membrane-fusion protein)
MKFRILVAAAILAVIAAAAFGTRKLVRAVTTQTVADLPSTKVRRGRVTISVTARGELQGGNTEMIVVPPTGADSSAITFLREPGEAVEAGDTVVEFDTTLQEYNLREAEADLAEAEQMVIQAQATSQSGDEENRYALLAAQSDVKLAELAVRSNKIQPALKARQNDIALEAAQGRLHQAEQNLANKTANTTAGVAIQQANLGKAKVTAEMNRKIIEGMSVKAKTSGYVNIQPNTSGNSWYYSGMTFQLLQLGDTVYSGMAVAQIPDMQNWEVAARIGELDRGHLAVGQKVSLTVVALPGKSFGGRVKTVGGTTGSPWDRHFDCRITLEQPAPEMRPGMTSNMLITAESLDDVLWIPSQALYESDGKTFVYMRSPKGFMPHDVTLMNRSESQAVVKGLNEGDVVAMSNPDQQAKPAGPQNGAMQALKK